MSIRDKFIPELRQAWRMWSLRLNALGLLILGWVQFDPASVLWVWGMMPDPVREMLPVRVIIYVGLALFVLSMISRVVKQPSIEKPAP